VDRARKVGSFQGKLMQAEWREAHVVSVARSRAASAAKEPLVSLPVERAEQICTSGGIDTVEVYRGLGVGG
jgi:hypothetical protein